MKPWTWLLERLRPHGMPVPPLPWAPAEPPPPAEPERDEAEAARPPPAAVLARTFPAAIVAATGCPAANVALHWPLLVEYLALLGILTRPAAVALAATVAIETWWRFGPVRERYNGDSRAVYFETKYGHRTSVGRRLGNLYPGDGALFYGRGFIQLTGRDNYEHFGRLIGVRLTEDPERALEPGIAAHVAALYWQERGVARAADAGDWPRVRRLVNGGLNGFDEFMTVVRRLSVATAGGPDPV